MMTATAFDTIEAAETRGAAGIGQAHFRGSLFKVAAGVGAAHATPIAAPMQPL